MQVAASNPRCQPNDIANLQKNFYQQIKIICIFATVHRESNFLWNCQGCSNAILFYCSSCCELLSKLLSLWREKHLLYCQINRRLSCELLSKLLSLWREKHPGYIGFKNHVQNKQLQSSLGFGKKRRRRCYLLKKEHKRRSRPRQSANYNTFS